MGREDRRTGLFWEGQSTSGPPAGTRLTETEQGDGQTVAMRGVQTEVVVTGWRLRIAEEVFRS